jgi:hypothetical protein
MWRLVTARGQEIPIRKLPASLGSDRRGDVVIPHASVKALHARLHEEPDGALRIEAVGDAVLGLGNRRVRSARLRGGERLLLGRVVLEVAAPERAPTGRKQRKQRSRAAPPKPVARSGWLATDLSQLTGTSRAVLVLVLLILGSAMVWGLSWGISKL